MFNVLAKTKGHKTPHFKKGNATMHLHHYILIECEAIICLMSERVVSNVLAYTKGHKRPHFKKEHGSMHCMEAFSRTICRDSVFTYPGVLERMEPNSKH